MNIEKYKKLLQLKREFYKEKEKVEEEEDVAICNVYGDGVIMLLHSSLKDMFDDFELVERTGDEYTHEIQKEIEGLTFFALVTEEQAQKHM